MPPSDGYTIKYQRITMMFKPPHRRLALTTIALSTFAVFPAAGQTINGDLKLSTTTAPSTSSMSAHSSKPSPKVAHNTHQVINFQIS